MYDLKKNVRRHRYQLLKEIGAKIIVIQNVIEIEKSEVLDRYLAIFDDVIEVVSNAITIDGINTFRSYFNSEYINMLKEFKQEYIKKYNLDLNDDNLGDYDNLEELYTTLNKERILR